MLRKHESPPKTLTSRPFPPIRPPAPCKDKRIRPRGAQNGGRTSLGVSG